MRLPGKVLGLGLAALFPPEAEQGGLVGTHDDPGIGATDERASVRKIGDRMFHFATPLYLITIYTAINDIIDLSIVFRHN
jgi:hypothetical protein